MKCTIFDDNYFLVSNLDLIYYYSINGTKNERRSFILKDENIIETFKVFKKLLYKNSKLLRDTLYGLYSNRFDDNNERVQYINFLHNVQNDYDENEKDFANDFNSIYNNYFGNIDLWYNATSSELSHSTLYNTFNLWDECRKINNAHRARVKRLRKRIEYMSTLGNGFFLTITFRDEHFEKLSYKTRRRYISWALDELSSNYVANVDYGEKTHREHYHALIISNFSKDEIKEKLEEKFGFCCVQFFKTIHFCITEKEKQINEYNKRMDDLQFRYDNNLFTNEEMPYIDCILKSREYTSEDFNIMDTIELDEKGNLKIAKYIAKLTNHALKETTHQIRIIYSKKKYEN